jgi:hypothetical protein
VHVTPAALDNHEAPMFFTRGAKAALTSEFRQIAV